MAGWQLHLGLCHYCLYHWCTSSGRHVSHQCSGDSRHAKSPGTASCSVTCHHNCCLPHVHHASHIWSTTNVACHHKYGLPQLGHAITDMVYHKCSMPPKIWTIINTWLPSAWRVIITLALVPTRRSGPSYNSLHWAGSQFSNAFLARQGGLHIQQLLGLLERQSGLASQVSTSEPPLQLGICTSGSSKRCKTTGTCD